jgi:hypothetical protein
MKTTEVAGGIDPLSPNSLWRLEKYQFLFLA